VLTPQPKLIPTDGSTIRVLIDGVSVGPPTGYDFFRSDVSTLFPGLKNSAGPVGFRTIDTTALSEGLHTIAWVVTDDGAATNGIGSRYFTVNNSAWQPSFGASFGSVAAALAVPARVDGVDAGRKAASLVSLPLDADGSRAIAMSSMQALELSLALQADPAGAGDTCAATYEGYLVVKGELRPLPVGASLDPAGTFYWQPGASFFGTYQLVFVRTGCGGARERMPVTIRIR
jgi:hypothetical protein